MRLLVCVRWKDTSTCGVCALFLLPCLGLYGECSDVLSRTMSLFRLKNLVTFRRLSTFIPVRTSPAYFFFAYLSFMYTYAFILWYINTHYISRCSTSAAYTFVNLCVCNIVVCVGCFVRCYGEGRRFLWCIVCVHTRDIRYQVKSMSIAMVLKFVNPLKIDVWHEVVKNGWTMRKSFMKCLKCLPLCSNVQKWLDV